MIPRSVRENHARTRGHKPLPCGYCFNYNPFFMTTIQLDDSEKVVVGFSQYGEQVRCDAGYDAPTSFGDCNGFIHMDGEYIPPITESVLRKLERDYYMSTLMTVYANDGITRTELVGRSNMGYNTRSERISDLIHDGLITSSYSVDNDVRYHITDSGEMIADAIHHLYLTSVLVQEEGNLFDTYPDAIPVFLYIRAHTDCTRRMVYDALDRVTNVEVLMDILEERRYIVPQYNSDYSELGYTISTRGIRALHVIQGGENNE